MSNASDSITRSFPAISHYTCSQCGAHQGQIIADYAEYLYSARYADDERRYIAAYLEQNGIRFDYFITCRSCGFVHIDPMPGDATLTHFYENYYGSGHYSQKGKRKILRARKRLRKLRRYVSGGRFLDVGCNLGFAVEAARLEGFHATGIEIDTSAIARAQELFPANHFSATTIADYAPDSAFDLIYCAEVIEHVPDTVDFAAHLARLLKPGGYLFMTTPDAGHWRCPDSFITWPEVKPPEHVCWHTKRSLHHLLTAQGFAPPRFFFKLKPSLHVVVQKR